MNEIIIGLIGVIVGAMLTIARDLYNEHRTQKKRAMYLALKVTCILDQFTIECTYIVGDDGYMHGGDEQGCATTQTSYPKLDLYSADVDWQSLPFYLMYETLSIHTHIEAANSLISSTYEYVSHPPDYEEHFEERQYEYAKLGLLANKLSNNLRQYYKMPKKHYEKCNPNDYLREGKIKIEKIKKTREQHFLNVQKSA